MRRSFWLAGLGGLGLAVTSAAQPPVVPLPAAQPAAPAQPAKPAAEWANKFFLPDVAANRDQPAPPVVTHDFGEVPHGTLLSHTFTVTNIYDVPVQVTEVRKSCTCLNYTPLTKALQPNETADFVVTMDAGKFVGFNAQTFYVTFGPKYVSTATLRVQATSRTEVSVTPGAVAFGTVPQGSKAAQSVTVKYGGRARDWKLTEVMPVKGPFEVKVTEVGRGGPLRGGAEYQVDVALKPTAAPGPLSEQVAIRTTDPAHPVVHVSVTGAVAAPVELNPGRVRFDGAAVGKPLTQRVLVRAAKPFRVLAVDGAGDGITVEVANGGAATPVHFLTVTFSPKAAGAVSRTLQVRTDLDGGTVALPVDAEAK
jgi:hypothetical protein